VINALNDYQLRQGMRRLAFSGKSSPPSLPEFVKLCRAIGHLDEIPDERPAQTLPALEQEWDRWLLAGNRRLMRYITTKIPHDQQRYGRRDEPQFATRINTLVAMKNRWVEVMQQSAGPDGVPPDEQNQCWSECMRTAETTIAQERAA
jgi:hypothetical protein